MRTDLFDGYSCPSCYNTDTSKFKRVEEIAKEYGTDWRCKCVCGVEFTIEWEKGPYEKQRDHHKKCEGYAAKMREKPTPAEAALWERLKKKQLGVRFIRQHIVSGWIADFACPSMGLIVEVDGKYHDDRKDKDEKRDWFLKRYAGYKVMRFTNEQVFNNVDSVLKTIAEWLSRAQARALNIL